MIGRNRNLSERREILDVPVKAVQAVRLDLYLRANLVWKSRGRIQDLIHRGHITVNGKQAKPSQAVRGGDRIEVRLSLGTGIPDDYRHREMKTIYEDPWILAIDKPAGMLVHPVGKHLYDTLINYLHYRYLEAGGADPQTAPRSAAPRRARRQIDESTAPRLCHRIDRDTTGILLVAKESYVHREMQRQFQDRHVSKEYWTIAHGLVPEGLRDIAVPIGEGKDLLAALEPPVRPTQTRIQVLGRLFCPGGDFTLLAARPVTGRQNQIRVHLAAIGHPIAGDTRYGGSRVDGFPQRYLLHARWVRFFHPRLKCAVELEAAPPDDFLDLIERLRAGGDADRHRLGDGAIESDLIAVDDREEGAAVLHQPDRGSREDPQRSQAVDPVSIGNVDPDDESLDAQG